MPLFSSYDNNAHKQAIMNRRDILKSILGFGIGIGTMPLFSEAAGSQARRLILVELSGANDGLNTLVPYRSDLYHQLRPTLSLRKNEVTSLHADIAMHKDLDPMMKHWDNGDLAWVQGLGYPTPNRSHFKSIALWESAGDGEIDVQSRGWMTHAMEHGLRRKVMLAHGISVGGDMNLFNSDSGRWLSISSASQLTNMPMPPSIAKHSNNQNRGSRAVANLEYVNTQVNLLNRMLSDINSRLENLPEMRGFAKGNFSSQLKTVAELIAGGIDTPVFRVRMGGFDTHENQLRRHARLLTSLGKGLDSMSLALKRMGEWNNTVIMTYSEFGRRAAENDSGGTDHGTAAPHLLLGGQVRGGLYGDAPDLSNLVDGDPEYTADYRGLYQEVLSSWFDVVPGTNTLRDYSDKRLSKLFV